MPAPTRYGSETLQTETLPFLATGALALRSLDRLAEPRVPVQVAQVGIVLQRAVRVESLVEGAEEPLECAVPLAAQREGAGEVVHGRGLAISEREGPLERLRGLLRFVSLDPG